MDLDSEDNCTERVQRDGKWIQVCDDILGEIGSDDLFGRSAADISADGSIIAIGATQEETM